MAGHDAVRLLLIGRPGTEFRLAAEVAREAGAQVTTADEGEGALDLLRATSIGLVMIDVELDAPAFIARLRAERFAVPVLACGIDAPATRAVAAIRAGARDYVPLPPQLDLIAAAIAAAVPQPAIRIVGDSPALGEATRYALAVARSRAPMLLTGEPGTGKQLLARSIHDASGLPGRFLTVECSGVPAHVVESELFGHEAGAFPGAAARRLGQLEQATDGTLLLRDVDCLAPATQAMLASALGDGLIRRVGGSDPVPVTARLLASTSRDLEARVAEGAFRADLLARLALVRVAPPPLRERASDIPLLVAHFAERLSAAQALPLRTFSDEALALLAAYSWPGNVRELEDVVHRALLLTSGPIIGPESIVLPDGLRIAAAAPPASAGRIEVDELVGRTVEEVERELILRTLERCHGNRTTASNVLGISVRTMRNKLKSFIEAGIPVAPAA